MFPIQEISRLSKKLVSSPVRVTDVEQHITSTKGSCSDYIDED